MDSPSPVRQSEEGLVYALVGNPNCGKTTLFNALTGLKQKVGNYPGVTVEKKEGELFSQHGLRLKVIDLPGAYSLNARSPDEAVLRDVLLGRRADTPRPDRVICVVDASNLERNLYLVSQIVELNLPIILVLNMADLAEKKGIRLVPAELSEKLGCPVVPMVASTKKGLTELKVTMSRVELAAPKNFAKVIPPRLEEALLRSRDELTKAGVVSPNASLLKPLYLLSGHDPTNTGLSDKDAAALEQARTSLNAAFPGWEDTLVADRYDAIHALCAGVIHRPDEDTRTLTDRIDSVVLHRIWGWVSLLLVLGGLFYLIFSVAEGPMGWIDAGFQKLSVWIGGMMSPGDFRDLLIDGALAGVNGVIVFLPQILILFFFIGLLEDTGYMARVAFIMDRLMGKVGLNGKSFLPLLSSYACAVPGVMAARTIDNPKDRLITILVVPLASCSARLPVYTLLIAALFSSETVPAVPKALIMLSMYVLGTLGAFFFAWLFKKKLMPGATSPLILELPTYKRPSLVTVVQQMLNRTWMFVRRAGTVILGLSILLWAASTFPKSDADAPKSEQLATSVAGRLGHLIEPVIKPLGYDWKIGIGLVSSFAAREVFVSSMSVIYAVEAEDDENMGHLITRLRDERWPDGRLIYTPAVCLSLMVFYVFAMQCLSTIAVVRRETGGWKWPLFQLGYMTGTAYLLALLVYQIGSRIS
ncbi:MAG: ferrous iron transport protein B [Verrucomicrobiales bacterium]|nr:ferrous iron transport protein B [Verrucomicrobiales bacterium]